MKEKPHSKIISIKINPKDIKNIIGNLNSLIARYQKKNGNTNNAVVFIPTVAFRTLKHFKGEVEIRAIDNPIRLIENKYMGDELIIIDITFFDFNPLFRREFEWQNQCARK